MSDDRVRSRRVADASSAVYSASPRLRVNRLPFEIHSHDETRHHRQRPRRLGVRLDLAAHRLADHRHRHPTRDASPDLDEPGGDRATSTPRRRQRPRHRRGRGDDPRDERHHLPPQRRAAGAARRLLAPSAASRCRRSANRPISKARCSSSKARIATSREQIATQAGARFAEITARGKDRATTPAPSSDRTTSPRCSTSPRS